MGTIASEATETVATAIIVECRRCLALGVDMKAPFIKSVLAQLESATTSDLSARADKAPANDLDGRNAAEVVVIT